MKGKRRKKSLQRRVVVSILLVGIISWVIGLISIYTFGKETIEKSIGANFQELASQTGKKIELIINHRIYEIKTLSSLELIKAAVEKANLKKDAKIEGSSGIKYDRDIFVYLFKFTDKGVANYLKGLMNNDPKEYLVLTDEKGMLVASTRDLPMSDFSDEKWWNMAFNKMGDIYISDIRYDDIIGDFALTMASPIIRNGKPRGVLSITRSRDLLFENVIKVKVGKTDHTMLASSDATIIFCPIFPPGTHLLDKLARAIFKDKPGWAITKADVHYPGRNSMNGFAPVSITFSGNEDNFGGKRWYIFSSQDPAETYAPIRVLFKWVTLTGLFGTLILTILGFYLTRRIINPIKELHKGMEVIGEGDLDYRLEIKTGDEIQDLADGFNEMVNRVRGSYSTLEAHGRNIINSITNGIMVVNAHGIIVTWNKTMISRYALASRDIFGKRICDVFPNLCNMGLSEKLNRLLRDEIKEFHLREIGHKMSKEGPKVTLNIDGYALKDVDEQLGGAVLVIEDITEKVSLEKQLIQAEKLATIGQLASGLAHEIGTPLNVIHGRAEYMMQRIREGDSLKKNLEKIISQIDRITRIVRQLLNYARVKQPNFQSADINSIIIDVLGLVDYQLENHKIFTVLQLDDNLLPIFADPDQLQQLILNIYLNAIDAMSKDGGTLTITTKGGVEKKNAYPHKTDHVIITVADTGHGIAREHIKHIFNPFFSLKASGEGTGMGLAVSYNIIQRHNGLIEVESELGKGSTFIIYLPQSKVEEISFIKE